MHKGYEGDDGRNECRHQVVAVVDPWVADGSCVVFDGLNKSHYLVVRESFFAVNFSLHSSGSQHAHCGQLFVAECAGKHVGRVDVEDEMGGTELQEVVVGAFGDFVECEDVASLHGFASLGVVVVDGFYGDALCCVDFVTDASREVGAIHIDYGHREICGLSVACDGGEENKSEYNTQRHDDDVAWIAANASHLAHHNAVYAFVHFLRIAVIPGRSPSMSSRGTTLTSKLLTSYCPKVFVALHVA